MNQTTVMLNGVNVVFYICHVCGNKSESPSRDEWFKITKERGAGYIALYGILDEINICSELCLERWGQLFS